MANKDINRIKVVLVDKRRLTSGLPNNWVKTKRQYLSGVRTLHNQIWKIW